MKTLITTIIVATALGAAPFQAAAAVAETLVEAEQPPDAPVAMDLSNLGASITGSIFGTPARSLTPPLVVGSIAVDAAALARMQEDLMVMSRILNKSLQSDGERDRQDLVSGIFISTFSSPRRPPSLYLEGYGALFLLGVKFPLVPPGAAEDVKIEKPADTTWEKTKREIFGPRNPAHGALVFNPHQESKPVKFDAERVETLKHDLLEALKNAANLRDVKPDDNVVVAVTGSSAGSAAGVRKVTKKGLRNSTRTTGDEVEVYTVKATDEELRHDSALVIRVKKSDIDAFAKGKLDFDEFQKKAMITAY